MNKIYTALTMAVLLLANTQTASADQGGSSYVRNQQTTSTGTVQKVSDSGPSLAETEKFLSYAINFGSRAVWSKDINIRVQKGLISNIGKPAGHFAEFSISQIDTIEKRRTTSDKLIIELKCRGGRLCVKLTDKKYLNSAKIAFWPETQSKLANQTFNALIHYAGFFNVALRVFDLDSLGTAFD